MTHAMICASCGQVGPADVVEDSEREVVVAELGNVVVCELVQGVGVDDGASVGSGVGVGVGSGVGVGASAAGKDIVMPPLPEKLPWTL